MSKYSPLRQYLERAKGRVALSFPEIERILGFTLPRSARLYAAWWSNSGGTHVQSSAWQGAGYDTQLVDLKNQTIQFVPTSREGFSEMEQASFASKAPSKPLKHPLLGCMKGTSIVMPGVDLTEPADPDWGKVYDDDYGDEFFPSTGSKPD
ncbi:DUF7662 domain-containing protein [Devosia sp. CAU 1758]